MQALRTLPILRPSRPSSPAPPSTQVSHSTANGTTQLPAATANGELKARSRSLSRQLTDKVTTLHLASGVSPISPADGNTLPTAVPGTLTKKVSPPGSRAPTPRTSAAPLPVENAAPATAYMDVLGLRLNEAVNRASAGVDYKAKKGFKKGTGWSVGEAVVKELPYPPNDAYLIRAVLRTVVRSLSIYITRLESLLLPALTDASFPQPFNLTAPSPTSHPLNPAQYFATSVAHAAWETCEVLEQTLETGKWPKFVSETLRPVMDKLDLVVGKVTQPLLISLKRDLVSSLARTEGTSPPGGKVIGLASIPNPTTGPDVPVRREPSNQPTSRLVKEPSQPGVSRSLAIPVCLQHFASRVDASRKVLEIVAAPCADDGEAWITNVLVAVVWKGMCVMMDREVVPASNRPPSPGSVSKALRDLGKERDATPAVLVNDKPVPGLAGVTAKLANPLSILPSRSASRAPSPPRGPRLHPSTHALMSLEGLVKRLVSGLVQPPLAPGVAPEDPNATEHLAREALDEALEALESFRIGNAAMHTPHGSSRILASLKRVRDDIDDPAEEALDDALEDLPAVALFAIIAKQANFALAQLPLGDDEKAADALKLKSPSDIWGWPKGEWERQVINGFGTAEEWGRRVAAAHRGEVERVLGGLARYTAASREKPVREVMEAVEWVKCLGVSLEARAAVKVAGL